jgi:hypothetical protein
VGKMIERHTRKLDQSQMQDAPLFRIRGVGPHFADSQRVAWTAAYINEGGNVVRDLRSRCDTDARINPAFIRPNPVTPDDEQGRLKAPKLAAGYAARRIPAAFRSGRVGAWARLWGRGVQEAAWRIGAAAVRHMPRQPWASGPISLARMPGRLVCCAHDRIGTRRRRAAASGGLAAPAE